MLKRVFRGSLPLIVVGLVSMSIGCQEFDRLRLILKPDQYPEGLGGPHRITLSVSPHERTVLELNGRQIQLDKTIELRGLREGEHRLILRAEGYETFATPIELKDHQHLDLAVHLQKLRDESSQESIVRRGASPNAPKLASNIHPAQASLHCASNVPPRIDGEASTTKATLDGIYGTMSCGDTVFRYQYTSDGELEVGPLTSSITFGDTRLEPGTRILVLPGKTTFLIPRENQPSFPIELRVTR